MQERELAAWPLIVLACVGGGGEKGKTNTALRKDLRAWLPGERASEHDTAIEEGLAPLLRGGLAEDLTKGKTAKWRITGAGAERLRAALNLPAGDALPSWPVLRDAYLVGVALDQRPETAAQVKQIKGAHVRGAILKKHHGLPIKAFPTKKQAVDALLWRELGVETDAAFTLGAVKRHLMQQVLGQESTALKNPQLENLIPARAVGARRADLAPLRLAAIGHWLRESGAGEATEEPSPPRPPAPEPVPPPPVPPSTDLATFAKRALAVARATPTGWFGDGLVFIAHVYRTFAERYGGPGLTLAAFKDRLVEAHRAGHLSIVRADLVEAMDVADVRASETQYLNGVFHFIRVPRGESDHGG